MGAFFRAIFVFVLVVSMAAPATAKRRRHSHPSPSPSAHKRTDAEIEAATRLQVFLDRANFSPGKIDGHYNDFTLKALTLYRQSRGEPVPEVRSQRSEDRNQGSEDRSQKPEVRGGKGPNQRQSAKPDSAPDLNGIDLGSVNPVFVQYTVTDADLKNIGPVPPGSGGAQVAAQKAKLPALPYSNVGEEIAEKFHADQKFLGELNPGKNGAALRPGDQVRVPNVEPFEVEAVKDLKPGSELTAEIANEMPDQSAEESPAPAATASVKVDVKSNLLGVFEGDRIVAAYPVTIGSQRTQTPIGEWKVRGVVKLPTFRYDEQMLNRGQRSGKFYILRPGPNNPVGVIWIALNKRGIGIHGTDEPDTIGKETSHGCIRLANWDIVRLAARVKAGVPVSVH